MKFSEFFEILKQNQDKELLFGINGPSTPIPPDYHITEVKHASIDSVNCGAGVDSWNETVIQLWEEPNSLGWESDKSKHMTVLKALKILSKVDFLRSFDPGSEVKFEYSNKNIPLVQMNVLDVKCVDDETLVVKLTTQMADCKAKEICGIKLDVVQSCCSEPGCC